MRFDSIKKRSTFDVIAEENVPQPSILPASEVFFNSKTAVS